MNTTCPLHVIAEAIADIKGDDWPNKCNGPECQWWPKCRRANQCPVCGEEGKPGKNESNRLFCPVHGYFYTDN